MSASSIGQAENDGVSEAAVAPGAGPGRRGRAARPVRGDHPAARAGRRPRRAARPGGADQGRGAGGGRAAGGHHLLQEGLHPADPAVPRPLRLLHLRDRPGRLDSLYLSPDEVLEIARQGAALGCKEALFTLGDRPEARWRQAREWLDAHGYDDTLSYVRAMAILVLEETGLLPHLNPGVMNEQDFQRLKPVAPSMGMMLETTAERLFTEQGRPALRLARQGPEGPPAGPGGRRARPGAVHHRHPHRPGRDAGRARRRDLRPAAGVPRVPRHPGSHRAELPGQAGHEDARHARRRAGRPRRHDRGHPAGARGGRPHPGAAEPRRRAVPAHPGRRDRRLGRRLPAHPGPREPRASLAADRRARPGHQERRASRCASA